MCFKLNIEYDEKNTSWWKKKLRLQRIPNWMNLVSYFDCWLIGWESKFDVVLPINRQKKEWGNYYSFLRQFGVVNEYIKNIFLKRSSECVTVGKKL